MPARCHLVLYSETAKWAKRAGDKLKSFEAQLHHSETSCNMNIEVLQLGKMQRLCSIAKSIRSIIPITLAVLLTVMPFEMSSQTTFNEETEFLQFVRDFPQGCQRQKQEPRHKTIGSWGPLGVAWAPLSHRIPSIPRHSTCISNTCAFTAFCQAMKQSSNSLPAYQNLWLINECLIDYC